MEDVLSFCDKTIKETNTKINQTEGILKKQLGKNEYEEMQKEIKSNDASTKNILHQRKLKIFNNLKHKPKAQIKVTTIKETENKEKPTYGEKNPRNPSRRQNLTNNLESNTTPNMQERLQSMSPTNKLQKQGNSQSQTIFGTSNVNDNKQ